MTELNESAKTVSDVVQISSVHPTFDTRVFEKCCKTLVERGWRVSLVIQADQAGIVDGVNLIPLERPRGRFGRVFKTGREAMKLALETGAPVCHVHDPELLLWTWMLTRRGRKVVFDMHENLPAAIRAKDWLPRWLRPVISRGVQIAERVLLRDKDVVLAETSYERDYEYLPRRIVVQNFPRTAQLSGVQAAKRAVPTLAYLGHIHQTRGSLTMVEVLRRLRQEGIEAELLLIGRVPPEHKLALLERAKEAGTKVEFAGHLAPLDAWTRVASCQVGMAVLSPEPNYITSYPTKMFEYMALGLPVVVSNFPLYREVIDQHACGYAVDPLDTDAVTAAVRDVLVDKEKAIELGRRGQRAVAGHYSWESEQTALTDLYTYLLDSRVTSNHQT